MLAMTGLLGHIDYVHSVPCCSRGSRHDPSQLHKDCLSGKMALLSGLECIDDCSCTDRKKKEMKGEGTVMSTLKQKLHDYVVPISFKLKIF